ncbi:unnamed protein product [Amoebophrya sp. A120]|nr:unnamed protein product [Amoebophrya sp. A120]|eukprot:GSA120T00007191001.1
MPDQDSTTPASSGTTSTHQHTHSPEYLNKVKKALLAARDGDVQTLREYLGTEEQWKTEQYLNDDEYRSSSSELLSPNVRDSRWRTLLMYACGFGQAEVVHFLLKNPFIQINARDDSNLTALHHCCRKNSKMRAAVKHDNAQAELVTALLQFGAMINAADSHGVTPLMVSVDVGDRNIAQKLINFVQSQELDEKSFLENKDYESHNAMGYAEYRNDMKMGTILYHAGLDVPQTPWGQELCDFIDERDGGYSVSEGEEVEDAEEEEYEIEEYEVPGSPRFGEDGEEDEEGINLSDMVPCEPDFDEEDEVFEDNDGLALDADGNVPKIPSLGGGSTSGGKKATSKKKAGTTTSSGAKKTAGTTKKTKALPKKKSGAKALTSTTGEDGLNANDEDDPEGKGPAEPKSTKTVKKKIVKKVAPKKKAPKSGSSLKSSNGSLAAEDDKSSTDVDEATAVAKKTKIKPKGEKPSVPKSKSKAAAAKTSKGKTAARHSRKSLRDHDDFGDDIEISAEDNSKEALVEKLKQALLSNNFEKIEQALTHAKAAAEQEIEIESDPVYVECQEKLKELRELHAAIDEACHACDDFEHDTGAGSSAENLKSLFQKFEQVVRKAENLKAFDLVQQATGGGTTTSPSSSQGGTANAMKHVKEVYDQAKARMAKRAKLEELCAQAKVQELQQEVEKLEKEDPDKREFLDKIDAFQNKQKAESMLNLVLQTKPLNIEKLKSAIAGLKLCGGDVSQAEQLLKVEEPKQLALDALEEKLHAATVSFDEVTKAFTGCKKLNILMDEPRKVMEKANLWIEKEKEKQKLLEEVKLVMDKTKDFEKIDDLEQDGEKLKQWEKECQQTFKFARLAGVLEADLASLEIRKKKLHNHVEDLKGSIRVFVRVRPFNEREADLGDHNAVAKIDSQTLSVEEHPNNPDGPKKEFMFDAAHFPGSQAQIFEDTKDLVQSAFDGYNVTIFAYGQTGAGKTYTMTGKKGDEGVVPRSCVEVFDIVERDKERFTFTISLHMIELYCAKFTDLLAKSVQAGNQASVKTPEIKVRREKDGSVQVENAVERQVESAKQMEKAIEEGFDLRSVAATAMNSESSRSHLITIVKLTSINKQTKAKTVGKLLMCDLAGCERIAKSEVTGQAQKEAIEINKSLTALGDVIEALTSQPAGKKFNPSLVPYRNHSLTQLMQDSLGGSSKTLMFMNCSPASSNVDETMNSLKYAERAKKVTNTVKKK